MNYVDFIDNVVSDHEQEYDLVESMPLALYEVDSGYRLRVEYMDDDLIIDEDGLVIELCECDKPIGGPLIWSATESYQLALGA